MVELFAGCGGLAIWKQSTFRIAKKEHPELWETNKDLKDVDELFLPNWEEELRDVQPGKKYSLRVDLNNFYQLGRAEMMQKIVRYFRKLGFPVCRDFIGRVEVWIPQELSDFILFNRFALRPYYRDVTDGWQIDVAHVGTSRCSKQTIFETNLEDNGFLVVAGTEVLHRQDVKQYHMQKFQGGHPVINTYTSRELHIPMQQTYDRNKLVIKRDKITQFIQTYLMTQAFQDALDINILNNGNFIAVKEENIKKVDDEAHHLIYGDKHVGFSPKGEFTHHGPYKMPEPHTFFIICSKKNKEWRNRLYNILQNGIDSTLINGQGVEHGSLCTFTPLPNLLNQPLNWEKNLSLTYNTNDTALKELKNHLSENTQLFTTIKQLCEDTDENFIRQRLTQFYFEVYHTFQSVLEKGENQNYETDFQNFVYGWSDRFPNDETVERYEKQVAAYKPVLAPRPQQETAPSTSGQQSSEQQTLTAKPVAKDKFQKFLEAAEELHFSLLPKVQDLGTPEKIMKLVRCMLQDMGTVTDTYAHAAAMLEFLEFRKWYSENYGNWSTTKYDTWCSIHVMNKQEGQAFRHYRQSVETNPDNTKQNNYKYKGWQYKNSVKQEYHDILQGVT